MAGFLSQSGHVGIRKQSAQGVFAHPGSGGVFFRTRSGALAGDRELLIPDPEIGGGRDVADAFLGPIKFSGEYDMYPRFDSFASMAYAALGAVQTTQDTPEADVHTHLISPTDTTLPWYSIEEQIANDYEHFLYTDAKVNTLHLEADATGYLMGTVGFIALSQISVPGASMTSNPSVDAGPMVVGTNTSIAFDGVVLPAKAFSFDINNNLEDDDFRLGSLFLGDAIEKRREITAGATLRPESSALWRQAMYGDPDATQAQGTVVKSDVEIIMSTYEFIGNSATVYSMTIAAQQAVFAPFAVTPSGEDAIEHDVEVRFLRPDVNEPICEITIVNGSDAVA